jgi:uncharacterized membrane protein YkvA (DUF1232 family)
MKETSKEASQPGDDLYQGMRRRIREWLARKGQGFRYADVLLVGPDLLHLLSKLAIDRRVPVEQKARIAGAIAYFVSPVDLMPEALIGPAGYIDDIAIAAYVLRSFIGAGHGDLAKEHWAGDQDLLVVIQRVLEIADGALGPRVWGRLKALVDGRPSKPPVSSRDPE